MGFGGWCVWGFGASRFCVQGLGVWRFALGFWIWFIEELWGSGSIEIVRVWGLGFRGSRDMIWDLGPGFERSL